MDRTKILIIAIAIIVGIVAVIVAYLLFFAPAPDVEPEPTAVIEPTEEIGPEPFTVTWWSEYSTFCCSDTRDDLVPDNINESGDLGRWMIDEWHKLHPEYDHVTIDMIPASYGDDAEVELDVLIQEGQTPNILEGFGGRMMSYGVELGIPLEDYFTDEMKADYLPGRWELLWRDDHIMMVSATASFYYPVINADLFREAGLEVPEAWSGMTWKEFEAVAEAVTPLDAYGSCLFLGSPGAIQWMWIPYAASGVSMFEGGDYSHVTFNTPEAVDVMDRLIGYEETGYVVPSATGLSVGDCIEYWKQGDLAVFFSQIGSARIFVNQAVEAGILEESYEIVPLLYVGGEKRTTPLILGAGTAMGAVITDETPEEHREAAFSFAQYVTSFPFADNMPLYAPYLQSQVDRNAMPSPEEAFALDYILEHGNAECGAANPVFTQLRPIWVEEAQAAFLGVKSSEQALSDYETRANELLE